MVDHVINDVYPLVLHGYLRSRAAPYILDILILRCVILGILAWDTACALTRVFARRPRQILESSFRTKAYLAAWLVTRALALAWIATGVQFPLKEYHHCQATVRTIAGLELVVVMLTSLLGAACLYDLGMIGSTSGAICIVSILIELAAFIARIVLLKSYSFVEDAGMCSWQEKAAAFYVHLWAQGDFWLTSSVSLMLDVWRNRGRGFDGQRSVKARKALDCLKYTLPVSASALSLIWTGYAWGDANTFGAIQPINLVVVAGVLASCKLVERIIVDEVEEPDWGNDKHPSSLSM